MAITPSPMDRSVTAKPSFSRLNAASAARASNSACFCCAAVRRSVMSRTVTSTWPDAAPGSGFRLISTGNSVPSRRAANVTLHTEPKIPGLDGKTLAKAGDVVRVQTDEGFQLQATGKIEVVQFLMGQGQTEEKIGDPTMMLVPPHKQYRNDYFIQTAAGFTKNWLTVVRPAGVAVQLDGKAIPDGLFQAFGDDTWEFAYAPVQTGTHHLESAQAFGLMVYGYGGVTAYGYPGGMNLK